MFTRWLNGFQLKTKPVLPDREEAYHVCSWTSGRHGQAISRTFSSQFGSMLPGFNMKVEKDVVNLQLSAEGVRSDDIDTVIWMYVR
ncbi:metallo-beta-lactamase superfamily protein [Moniliophthora roreri]|nr:metallo-beta-lactamase superfamily protein [Moniliophthora roreri]